MSTRRPTIPVEQAQMPLYAGVDVGGTNTKIGIVDDLGRPLALTRMATEGERGPEEAIKRITATLRQLLETIQLTMQDVTWVGLGTPGTMDIPAGLILEPPNLPAWRNYPIRDRLSDRCGRPVAFANDAGAAAYGEFWVGSGQEFNSIVLLTLGTGVGGGIIVGDMSIDGEHSHGSECGHIIIDYTNEARMCPCGQRGHLEAYASATALIKRAEEALEANHDSTLRPYLGKEDELNGLLIARHAEAGDELARRLVLDTAMYLGVGIVSLMHTIDPAAVILGGAMNWGGHDTPLGCLFLERVRAEVRDRAFPIPAQRTVIDYAKLGGDAGLIGAAGVARLAHRRKKATG